MTTGKLTDTACRNAKPRAKAYKLADGGGLHLLVQPGGSKLWRQAYRFAGAQRTLSHGSYPVLTLGDARDLRDGVRRQLAFGIDPAGAKPSISPVTFEAVAREWLALWREGKDSAHADRVEARLENDILAAMVTPDGASAAVAFARRPIGDIEPPEVLQVVRKVEGRGALDVAKRVRGQIGQIFRYGIAAGVVKRDAAADIGDAMKPRPRVKHFVKIPMTELSDFLGRLARYDGDDMTRRALGFTLLTWVRSNETRFARWSEFEQLDGAAPLWRIPAARMKMAREHLVPLSPQAVALLREVPRSAGSEFVFWSGQTKDCALSTNTMIYALYRLGYHGRQTVHGFRGLASTWANEALLLDGQRRYHQDWVEMQLAHGERDAVREAYNAAEYLAPRRAMLEDWGALIEREERVGLLFG